MRNHDFIQFKLPRSFGLARNYAKISSVLIFKYESIFVQQVHYFLAQTGTKTLQKILDPFRLKGVTTK